MIPSGSGSATVFLTNKKPNVVNIYRYTKAYMWIFSQKEKNVSSDNYTKRYSFPGEKYDTNYQSPQFSGTFSKKKDKKISSSFWRKEYS
jgi:hypothetical protein